MKKISFGLAAVLLLAITLTGCAAPSQAPVTPVDIRIAGMKGPTSLGMLQLMEQAEQGKAANRYTFSIVGSADEITPKLMQGELDIAAIPANLAAVLYKNSQGAIQIMAVNTNGVNYIVEKGNTVSTLADLQGKTVYATGKGSVPEYILRYLLTENGIDPDKDVTIEWKSEPTEVVALLAQQASGIALLPQPYIVTAQAKLPELRTAVDLTAAWNTLDNGSQLITGVTVVRREFAEANPAQIEAFLQEYQNSVEYTNTEVAAAAQLAEKFGIIKANVAEKAIPDCSITYLAGADMKAAVEGYLAVLLAQNPKSIGGALPADDFYYGQ